MKTLLIVEDDATFAAGLVRTFSRRGYSCLWADSCSSADDMISVHRPTHVLLDLNLGGETTQEMIARFRSRLPQSVIVILTGFGTIPSTVRAIKDGANQYLCKPLSADAIEAALQESLAISPDVTPLWDLEKSHILQVLENCGGNISRAAKTLGLHRRTLQRRLKKT
jgi:two-component system response regulator RegA